MINVRKINRVAGATAKRADCKTDYIVFIDRRPTDELAICDNAMWSRPYAAPRSTPFYKLFDFDREGGYVIYPTIREITERYDDIY